MTKKPGKRLGRGLSSLVSTDISRPPTGNTNQLRDRIPAESGESLATGPAERPAPGTHIMSIPLEQIRTNPAQPRREFDQDKLQALAKSLKEEGALQPIVVRHCPGGYELVAGERRFRASKLAGLEKIPAVIRAVRDDKLLELALIENVQREDLNPVEKARAYRLLAQKHGMTHDQIAESMGEDRSTVANFIRLLGLNEQCLELLGKGLISTGHAKALLAVADVAHQIKFADQIVREEWSVRRTEQEIAKAKEPKPEPEPKQPRSNVADMETQLRASLGTKVAIKEGRKRHSGKIIIEYYNLEDFQRLAERMGVNPESL